MDRDEPRLPGAASRLLLSGLQPRGRGFPLHAPGNDPDGEPVDGRFPANWQYDSPKYNWLADPYGAAVNPVFWKIHGYVDQLIDAWLKANDYGPLPSRPASPSPFGGGAASSAERDAANLEFNKARMRFQNIGVLTDSPSRFPSPKRPGKDTEPAALDDDPVVFVDRMLCSRSGR